MRSATLVPLPRSGIVLKKYRVEPFRKSIRVKIRVGVMVIFRSVSDLRPHTPALNPSPQGQTLT